MNNLSGSLRFTNPQKEAAIYGLYQIARSDSELAENEIDLITKVGELLGEVFDHMSISKLIVKNSYEHVNELMKFSDVQKEWFIVASYAMINCDNKLVEEEFTIAHGFFQVMGISSEKATDVIKKMDNGISFY